jgi:hypothetical protein
MPNTQELLADVLQEWRDTQADLQLVWSLLLAKMAEHSNRPTDVCARLLEHHFYVAAMRNQRTFDPLRSAEEFEKAMEAAAMERGLAEREEPKEESNVSSIKKKKKRAA